MKAAFKAGTRVRFANNGAQATITDTCKTWDWKIPGYLGEGWYEVEVDGERWVAHEDDLLLGWTPEIEKADAENNP